MLKKYESLLNLDKTITKELFENVEHPWEVLPKINEFILNIKLDENYNVINDNIYIHKTAKVESSALIKGPTIIGANTEIRHCAFIRGNVIIGENCVIGNSTEVKNSIIFDNAECPHFNYIGDSILGYHAHTGAGVILANLKNDKTNIVIKDNDEVIETNLRKIGAILGDNTNIGCNSVVFPGTIIGENVDIYPLTRVRGIIQPNTIVKDEKTIISKK